MHCHNGNLSFEISMRNLKGARVKGNGEMVSWKNLTAQFVMRKVIDRSRLANHILRNWSFMLASHSYYILSILASYTPQVEQIIRQMRHLTTLNMSLVCCTVHLIRLAYLILQTQTVDVEVFVHTRKLRTLCEDSRERMENFVRSPFFILATWYQIKF